MHWDRILKTCLAFHLCLQNAWMKKSKAFLKHRPISKAKFGFNCEWAAPDQGHIWLTVFVTGLYGPMICREF